MSSYLCLTIRFLGERPTYHGRRDGGEPEWPPSPLRVLQALVAAAASQTWGDNLSEENTGALRWMEGLPAPTILAPSCVIGTPFRTAVPNNDLDAWATPLSKGNEPKKQPSELKTLKPVRPVFMKDSTVYYLYPLSTYEQSHVRTLTSTARTMSHLGWGIDLVAADASVVDRTQSMKIPGETWKPADGLSGIPLRVPIRGTLAELSSRHEEFRNRITGDGLKPMLPLPKSAFSSCFYARESDLCAAPFAAFSILNAQGTSVRSFNTSYRCRDVAAWVRHATSTVCNAWPYSDSSAFVHGHRSGGDHTNGHHSGPRFAYLPLPTINSTLKRVESIRRVLITAPSGYEDRVDWIRRRLAGQDLVEKNASETVSGILNILPTSDWVLRQYTDASRSWSTVTPVVWPRHSDDPDECEQILRKAFVQAGLSQETVDTIEELDWSTGGFRAGVELARRYLAPDKIRGRQFHVRVKFKHPVSGPLAVGSGRFRGLGLFAIDA